VDERREAVRGAGSVRDDVVLGSLVLVVVDADDDGDVFILGRGRDDDLLGAGIEVTLGLGGFGEEASRFDDDLDAELTPRISLPFTTRTSSSSLSGEDFLEETVPLKRPCVESYFRR
jgi:hypothetical protein